MRADIRFFLFSFFNIVWSWIIQHDKSIRLINFLFCFFFFHCIASAFTFVSIKNDYLLSKLVQKIYLFTLQFVAFCVCVCVLNGMDGIIRSNSQGDCFYLFTEFHGFLHGKNKNMSFVLYMRKIVNLRLFWRSLEIITGTEKLKDLVVTNDNRLFSKSAYFCCILTDKATW